MSQHYHSNDPRDVAFQELLDAQEARVAHLCDGDARRLRAELLMLWDDGKCLLSHHTLSFGKPLEMRSGREYGIVARAEIENESVKPLLAWRAEKLMALTMPLRENRSPLMDDVRAKIMEGFATWLGSAGHVQWASGSKRDKPLTPDEAGKAVQQLYDNYAAAINDFDFQLRLEESARRFR